MTISANFPAIRPSLLLDFANSQQLDPRITFSRPTTATYYDANTTALAEQNFIIQSQQIGNASWGNQNCTAVLNTTSAPDATTTASLIYPNASVTFARTYNINSFTYTANVPYTFSVYAKASGINYITLTSPINGGTGVCWFNVSTGTLGTNTLGGTASITSVGNGWYRCVVTYSAISGNTYSWIICDADNSTVVTPSGTNGVYLWGAQLEQRSSVTAYNATTTTAITNYIPVLLTAPTNQARFDHDPVARTSLGLLIEQQSTNLLTWSSDYTNAVWAKSGSTITTAADISPDGTQNFQKIVEDTSTGAHSIGLSLTLTASTIYTTTIYAKQAGRSRISIYEYSTTGAQATFDLSAGTVVGTSGGGTPSATITNVGNGVYRCSMTWTTGATSAISYRVQRASDTGVTSYAGDGFSGLYIWGAQLEALAFPTSYIPTVASQVTRAQDFATISGTNFSSWFNNQQGSIYCSFDQYSISSSAQASNIWGIGTTTGDQYYIYKTTSTLFYYFGFGVNAGTITANTLQQTGYAFTNIAPLLVTGNLNGSAGGTYGGMSPFTTNPTQLIFNRNFANNYVLSGHFRKFAFYPIQFTLPQMQALTGS